MKKYTLSTIAAMLILSACSYATIHFVSPETESISDFILTTSPGDTIILEEGIYDQKIGIVNADITIGSRDLIEELIPPASQTTILDGTNADADGYALIYIYHSDAVVYGLTMMNNNNVINGQNTYAGGICIDSSNVIVDHCSISNNQACSGGGIYTRRGNTTILNSEILENTASFTGGIYVSVQEIEIRGCKISGNITTNLDGGNLGIFSSFNVTIAENIIANGFGDLWAGGILMLSCDNVDVSKNIFRSNHSNDMGGAIRSSRAVNLRISDNIFCGNTAGEFQVTGSYSGIGGALVCYQGEEVEILHNTFIGNKSNGAVVLERTNGISFHDNMFLDNPGYHYTAFYLWGQQDSPANITIENNAFKYHHHDETSVNAFQGVVGSRRDSELIVHHNDFIRNEGKALGYGYDPGLILDNTNYWGHPSGPYHQTLNPGGEGDTIDVDITYTDFATEQYWDYNLEYSDAVLNFGNIEVGSSTTLEVELTNLSEFSLLINYFEFLYDNVFSIPLIDSLTIGSNHSYLIPVTFTPLDTIDYFDVLSTVATDYMASGSTIELTGSGIPVTNVEEKDPLPTSFHVSEPHPNPFNSQTRISVYLPESGFLDIDIYDINGRIVRQVCQGIYNSGINGFDLNFEDQSSGIYFVKIKTSKHNFSRKLVLVR